MYPENSKFYCLKRKHDFWSTRVAWKTNQPSRSHTGPALALALLAAFGLLGLVRTVIVDPRKAHHILMGLGKGLRILASEAFLAAACTATKRVPASCATQRLPWQNLVHPAPATQIHPALLHGAAQEFLLLRLGRGRLLAGFGLRFGLRFALRLGLLCCGLELLCLGLGLLCCGLGLLCLGLGLLCCGLGLLCPGLGLLCRALSLDFFAPRALALAFAFGSSFSAGSASSLPLAPISSSPLALAGSSAGSDKDDLDRKRAFLRPHLRLFFLVTLALGFPGPRLFFTRFAVAISRCMAGVTLAMGTCPHKGFDSQTYAWP